MKVSLNITVPSDLIGVVEYRRSFAVEGDIISHNKIPDDSEFLINIYDNHENIVRWCRCDRKNKEICDYYDGLTGYEEKLDPERKKMQEFEVNRISWTT